MGIIYIENENAISSILIHSIRTENIMASASIDAETHTDKKDLEKV